MDYSSINLMQMMKAKMGYLSQRQKVLSENIANSDTPGFQPRDVIAPDFSRMASAASHKLAVASTNSKHITSSAAGNGMYRDDKMRHTYAVTPTKNSVVLEEQMMLMADTQMDYMKVTNLYNKTVGMFKKALGSS